LIRRNRFDDLCAPRAQIPRGVRAHRGRASRTRPTGSSSASRPGLPHTSHQEYERIAASLPHTSHREFERIAAGLPHTSHQEYERIAAGPPAHIPPGVRAHRGRESLDGRGRTVRGGSSAETTSPRWPLIDTSGWAPWHRGVPGRQRGGPPQKKAPRGDPRKYIFVRRGISGVYRLSFTTLRATTRARTRPFFPRRQAGDLFAGGLRGDVPFRIQGQEEDDQ
jgi:hypothetical protein